MKHIYCDKHNIPYLVQNVPRHNKHNGCFSVKLFNGNIIHVMELVVDFYMAPKIYWETMCDSE